MPSQSCLNISRVQIQSPSKLQQSVFMRGKTFKTQLKNDLEEIKKEFSDEINLKEEDLNEFITFPIMRLRKAFFLIYQVFLQQMVERQSIVGDKVFEMDEKTYKEYEKLPFDQQLQKLKEMSSLFPIHLVLNQLLIEMLGVYPVSFWNSSHGESIILDEKEIVCLKALKKIQFPYCC